MLADNLAALAGSFDDRIFGGAFTRLAERIKRAQRFDLTPEVMRSPIELARRAGNRSMI